MQIGLRDRNAYLYLVRAEAGSGGEGHGENLAARGGSYKRAAACDGVKPHGWVSTRA